MRKFFTIIGILLGLASCELETSTNGDLDGFWLITDVDTIATGGHVDLRDSSYTWSFQGRIMEVRRASHMVNEAFICKFEHRGGFLRVYDIYQIAREFEDPLMEDVTKLRPYGINQLDECFMVLKLNDDRMILESSGLRLYFRKY